MNIRYLGRWAVIIFSFVVSACSPPGELKWDSPNSSHYTELPDIQFEWVNNSFLDLYPMVYLNQRDITEQIQWTLYDEERQVLGEAEIIARGNADGVTIAGVVSRQAIQAHTHQGGNVISVEFGETANIKNFIYDTEAPEIVILKSTAHDPNADPVKIHAVALDASGLERVVINNQQVSLEDDGRFEVEVPRSDIFNFLATDIHGYQTTRQFADLYNEY
ncbi:MAG: hypothetical protein MI867_02415, partial [Pseudomonadales bacterium]|nr:hypothetical protein [Pseudomonadales bacterium]